jgi:hypothetical protein
MNNLIPGDPIDWMWWIKKEIAYKSRFENKNQFYHGNL